MNPSQKKYWKKNQRPELGVVKEHFYYVLCDDEYKKFIDDLNQGFDWIEFGRRYVKGLEIRDVLELEIIMVDGKLYGGEIGKPWLEIIPNSEVKNKGVGTSIDYL